jgi:hypothetical protein
MALTRTVLEISMDPKLGWPAAIEYATQLLNARVAMRESFAAIDDQCLTNVRHSLGVSFARGGPAAAAQSSNQSRGQCVNWNWNSCSGPDSGCRNGAHTCWNMRKGCPGGHPGKECTFVKRPRGGGSGGSSRGSRGGVQRSSSTETKWSPGSTVVSAKGN